MLFKNREKREKRKRFAHIGAGIVILIHAYEKFESGHGNYQLYTFAGIIFLIIAILHPIIEKKVPWVDGIFFFIEAVLSICAALDFFHLGKKALPITYLLLSVVQLFMAFRSYKSGIKRHKSTH